MKYHRYLPSEVINLTRNAIHSFTNRDMVRFASFLDESFSFIADDEPFFLQGMDVFLKSVRRESESSPVTITDEEYTLLAHERALWVTFGRFQVSSPPMTATIHFTFVWKQKEDALLLLHANAAHARPLPPQTQPDMMTDSGIVQAHMFDESSPKPSSSADSVTQLQKQSYRDLDGHIRYLSDADILFFQSKGKICEVHTVDQKYFSVRTALRTLERSGFLLIHRSYIVNLDYVKEIYRYRAILNNGTALPIGQEKYLPLKGHLKNFLMQDT
ncbi:MAG: LytTR family DNA-binding domain-containing protein [bacterium]|nr:LytTR family DNA-binding domain-containing protein [bacterium]